VQGPGVCELVSAPPAAGDRLLREIDRYLAAVECFRAEGYEPQWRLEAVSAPYWTGVSDSQFVERTAGG
jgi:hypothetical protein